MCKYRRHVHFHTCAHSSAYIVCQYARVREEERMSAVGLGRAREGERERERGRERESGGGRGGQVGVVRVCAASVELRVV